MSHEQESALSALTMPRPVRVALLPERVWLAMVQLDVFQMRENRSMRGRTRPGLRPPPQPPHPPPPPRWRLRPLLRWVRIGNVRATRTRTWLRCFEVVTHPAGRFDLRALVGG